MSIQTKGTRKITVDEKGFLWLIRRKATYTQECFLAGCIHVAVQDIEKQGSTLMIVTDRFHPQGFMSGNPQYKNIPVTPSDVKLWIKQAIQLGWQPEKPGKTFYLRVEEISLQKFVV